MQTATQAAISKHLKSLKTEVSLQKIPRKKPAAVCLSSLPMILTNATSDRPSGPARPCLPWLSTWSALYRSKQLGLPQATSPASYVGHFQKLLSIRFAFDSPRIGVDRQITWSLLEIQILYCTTYLNSTTIRLKNEDVMPFLNLNAM